VIKKPQKKLSLFGLVMINVIAIDSLRTLPISAEYGASVIFFYLLAALIFFIPSAFVAAELATGWPETGGVYIWVREAFGKKWGFMTIWLQWFYNICWYPTIMSLIAATIAYCINPALVNDKLYMISVIMIFFWGATLVNCLGMKASNVLTNVSAVIGTLLPMTFVILLGVFWCISKRPIAVDFSLKAMLPDLSHLNNLVLLTAMFYGFVGMEMSAVHAGEVDNPQHSYPKAMIWSVILILLTMVLGTLAIEVVVPVEQLNIVAGLLEAFSIFLNAFHLTWVLPIVAFFIVVGALGGAAAWMLGPSKGMLVASRDGCFPTRFGQMESGRGPVQMLLLQGGIFTVLCSVFILMPTVASGFWVLSDVTSILALVVYVAMFAAAIRLRYKYPEVKRAFRIPGGKIGLWVTCLLGLFSSIFTIFLGFLPPSQIPVGSLFQYETLIIIGFIVGCLFPFVFYYGYQFMRGKHHEKTILATKIGTNNV
jgi:glutamate:GABA antiporter